MMKIRFDGSFAELMELVRQLWAGMPTIATEMSIMRDDTGKPTQIMVDDVKFAPVNATDSAPVNATDSAPCDGERNTATAAVSATDSEVPRTAAPAAVKAAVKSAKVKPASVFKTQSAGRPAKRSGGTANRLTDITTEEVKEAIDMPTIKSIPELFAKLLEHYRPAQLIRWLEIDAAAIHQAVDGHVYPYVERAVRQHLGFPAPTVMTVREKAGL